MTVNTTDAFVQYLGDGVTREFPFAFPAFEASWMDGWVDRIPQAGSAVLNPDQNTNAGGVFTFDVAPALDSAVTIIRIADFLQQTDYPPFTEFPAQDHEEALDKLTMLTQQLFYLVVLLQGDASLYVLKAGDAMDGQLLALATTGATPDEAVVQKIYVDLADQILQAEVDLKANLDYVIAQDTILQDQITANNDASIARDDVLTTGKADKAVEVISGDTETITVTNPTLADNVTITTRTNVSNGLVKLLPDGTIPNDLISVNGIQVIGFWDASTGFNPSETNPATDYEIGQAFLISVGGVMNLIDSADGLIKPLPVDVGDTIVFLEPTPENPTLVEGWLPISASTNNAVNILFNNVGTPFVSSNLQEMTEECKTGAISDVQINKVDPTVGRLLTVGSFGLGALSSDTVNDFNELLLYPPAEAYGTRYANSGFLPANAPAGSNYWHVQTSLITTFYFAQRISGIDSDVESVWERLVFNDGITPQFFEWKKVAHEGNPASFGNLNIETSAFFVNPDTGGGAAVKASSGLGRRALNLYGHSSGEPEGGWIGLGGVDDSQLPNQVRLGFGGATIPWLTVTSETTGEIRNAMRFKNPLDGNASSGISADSAAGRHALSMQGGNFSSALIKLYGDLDSTFPHQVHMHYGTSVNPEIAITGNSTSYIRGRTDWLNKTDGSVSGFINAVEGAGRRVLQVTAGATGVDDGAFIQMHGATDPSFENQIAIGNTAGTALFLTTAGSLQSKDSGGTLRTIATKPTKIANAIGTILAAGNFGNTQLLTSTLTLNDVVSVVDGEVAQFLTDTNVITVIKGAGTTVLSLKDGVGGTVTSVTVAANSVFSIYKHGVGLYYIWGSGLTGVV